MNYFAVDTATRQHCSQISIFVRTENKDITKINLKINLYLLCNVAGSVTDPDSDPAPDPAIFVSDFQDGN